MRTLWSTLVWGGVLMFVSCDRAMGKPHRVPAGRLPDSRAESSRLLTPSFAKALSDAALERTTHSVRYDGRYLKIGYPMGDVPPEIGVCSDVVIRAYRKLGIDLQKDVHEDMAANFRLYPRRWGLTKPDTNIDHRRVLNLEVLFARKGVEVAATKNPADYLPGDLVTWSVGGSLPHIGIVVDRKAPDGKTPMIVHNIGAGDVLEDILFAYPMTGHFRYAGLELHR